MRLKVRFESGSKYLANHDNPLEEEEEQEEEEEADL
jgi:hypothetical protein